MNTIYTVSDFADLARQNLPAMAWEYLASGAGDELTLRWNGEAFDRLELLPNVLCDVSSLDTSIQLLGKTLPHPVLLAPTAYHGLYHPEAECETARGAVSAKSPFVVSTMTNRTIEEIESARTSAQQRVDQDNLAPLWFQLYVQKDKSCTRHLIERAEAAGCEALVVTVDTPVIGNRVREIRAGFRLPEGLDRAMLRELPEAASVIGHQTDSDGIYYPLTNAAMVWDDIQWMISITKLPVLLKGILRADDAERAVKIGAHGVIVSNHGGRNLDTVPATIEVLPEVYGQIAHRIPVLLDGGIRRGTDIVKAIALGASAVLIGRPYCWGLAVGGSAGIEQVVRLLLRELKLAMALCGRGSVHELRADLVRRRPC